AECMGAEASIAFLEQRPDAIAVAMKALAACRSLPNIPPALELRILNGLAVAQCRYGEFEEAIKTFEKAIELADPVVDMRRLGKLLDCAGIACRELGRMEQAVNYCSRAVALFETLKDSRSLAVAENDLGWALLGCGDLAGARQHLHRSLQLHQQGNLTTDRSAVLSSLCELCVAEGDLEQATTYADAALDFGERQSEAWSIADARMWKGRIAMAHADDAEVDTQFRLAVAALENSGMTMRLVQCHAEYAEILKRRGNLPVALEHMKAAVRITTSGGIPRGATSVHEPPLLDVGAAVAEAGPRIDPE
ncbi:MAG TPA: tetratricopeptide repeat protein, partial [Candidatus Dormibacteraeota bacterium]|nr:tetratricopeptide repeat protein [Candidatus Dormibacteraeota bacterium]